MLHAEGCSRVTETHPGPCKVWDTDAGAISLVAPAAEAVDHPQHYGDVPGIECIDVVEHFSFNRGNAIKYLWRAGSKGNVLEDLKKARWYVQREIDNMEKP